MGDKFVCIGHKPTRDAPAGEVLGNRTPGVAQNLRMRVTTAEVNAGHTLLAAIAGYKYRMIDCIMIAVGGNATTATGVQIKGGDTVLVDAKVAALEQSDVARAGDTNVDVLADGASFVAQSAGEAVTIEVDGTDMTEATHVDVILTYAIEE